MEYQGGMPIVLLTTKTMTHSEEQELLELTRQNNMLLRAILRFVQHDEANDFMTNIVANLVANKIEGNTYVQRSNRIS